MQLISYLEPGDRVWFEDAALQIAIAGDIDAWRIVRSSSAFPTRED